MPYHFQISLSPHVDIDENGNQVLDSMNLNYWPYPANEDGPDRSRGCYSISWTACELFIREDLGLNGAEQDKAFDLLSRGGFEYPRDVLPAAACCGIDGTVLLRLGIDLDEYARGRPTLRVE